MTRISPYLLLTLMLFSSQISTYGAGLIIILNWLWIDRRSISQCRYVYPVHLWRLRGSTNHISFNTSSNARRWIGSSQEICPPCYSNSWQHKLDQDDRGQTVFPTFRYLLGEMENDLHSDTIAYSLAKDCSIWRKTNLLLCRSMMKDSDPGYYV